MLERKWPDKYNAAGHLSWAGRVYAKAIPNCTFWSRQRIYHGTWGTALFQSIYNVAPNSWASLLTMPEWYLIVSLLGVATAVGIFYAPLQWMAAGFALTMIASLIRAVTVVGHIQLHTDARNAWKRLKYRAVITGLHLLQPAARLWGRLTYGLTPWRRRGPWPFVYPWNRPMTLWDEAWRSVEERLGDLETSLKRAGAIVVRGGNYDAWDLEVRGGLFADARILMTIEEHGQGKQFVRIKVWPAGSHWVVILAPFLISVAISAAMQLDLSQNLLINIPCALLVGWIAYEIGSAAGVIFKCFKQGTPNKVVTVPEAKSPPVERLSVAARETNRAAVRTSATRKRTPANAHRAASDELFDQDKRGLFPEGGV
jgi:O-antigen biosynthesis protein